MQQIPVMDRRGHLTSRRFTAVLCAALLSFQVGCYSYLPVQDAVPPAGEPVSITLNDRGRQLVGNRLGEEVDRVEGSVVSFTEATVNLSVTKVRSLRGSTAVWTGEQVDIPREGIRGFQRRQFSKGRTAMFTVALIAGAVAIASLVTFAVSGLGNKDGGNPPCPAPCLPGQQ